MRLLLDTHVFIWAVMDNRKLKSGAREAMRSADEVFVSAASIWEIGIKARLGKIEGNPELLTQAIEASGFLELPVSARHGAAVAKLPLHHADPFDRMLVAQAIMEPLHLLTADPVLARYSELVQIV